MYKQEYRSGMDKISATDAWRQETLEKMCVAKAQAVSAALAPVRAQKNGQTVPFVRKAALGAAAAVALLAVPALYFMGNPMSQTKGAAPQAAIAEKGAAPYAAAAQDGEGAQNGAVPRVLSQEKECLPADAADISAHTEDEACATVLAGEGFLAEARQPGGYQTEALQVLQCALETQGAADAAPLPGALYYPVYRCAVRWERQGENTDKSLQPEAVIYVQAQTNP